MSDPNNWLIVALTLCAWLLLAGVAGLSDHWRHKASNRSDEKAPDERTRAQERAESLLRDTLGASRYTLLREQGYLDIPSSIRPERVYRVPRSRQRVRVYEYGQPVLELCVQPIMLLPSADVFLTHKFMIEGAEEVYLAHANEVPLASPRSDLSRLLRSSLP